MSFNDAIKNYILDVLLLNVGNFLIISRIDSSMNKYYISNDNLSYFEKKSLIDYSNIISTFSTLVLILYISIYLLTLYFNIKNTISYLRHLNLLYYSVSFMMIFGNITILTNFEYLNFYNLILQLICSTCNILVVSTLFSVNYILSNRIINDELEILTHND